MYTACSCCTARSPRYVILCRFIVESSCPTFSLVVFAVMGVISRQVSGFTSAAVMTCAHSSARASKQASKQARRGTPKRQRISNAHSLGSVAGSSSECWISKIYEAIGPHQTLLRHLFVRLNKSARPCCCCVGPQTVAWYFRRVNKKIQITIVTFIAYNWLDPAFFLGRGPKEKKRKEKKRKEAV